jgi:hypothetical protein
MGHPVLAWMESGLRTTLDRKRRFFGFAQNDSEGAVLDFKLGNLNSLDMVLQGEWHEN